jgi:hypothetical protein
MKISICIEGGNFYIGWLIIALSLCIILILSPFGCPTVGAKSATAIFIPFIHEQKTWYPLITQWGCEKKKSQQKRSRDVHTCLQLA